MKHMISFLLCAEGWLGHAGVLVAGVIIVLFCFLRLLYVALGAEEHTVPNPPVVDNTISVCLDQDQNINKMYRTESHGIWRRAEQHTCLPWLP